MAVISALADYLDVSVKPSVLESQLRRVLWFLGLKSGPSSSGIDLGLGEGADGTVVVMPPNLADKVRGWVMGGARAALRGGTWAPLTAAAVLSRRDARAPLTAAAVLSCRDARAPLTVAVLGLQTRDASAAHSRRRAQQP